MEGFSSSFLLFFALLLLLLLLLVVTLLPLPWPPPPLPLPALPLLPSVLPGDEASAMGSEASTSLLTDAAEAGA